MTQVIEIRGHRDGELAWIEKKARVALTRHAQAVVADDDGEIVGMVAFDDCTNNSAQAHMAVSKPAVWLRLLRPAFEYVFQQQRKRLLVGVIPADNEASLRFTRGIGFRETYRVKDGWDVGVDLVVLEMRCDECRWQRRS